MALAIGVAKKWEGRGTEISGEHDQDVFALMREATLNMRLRSHVPLQLAALAFTLPTIDGPLSRPARVDTCSSIF